MVLVLDPRTACAIGTGAIIGYHTDIGRHGGMKYLALRVRLGPQRERRDRGLRRAAVEPLAEPELMLARSDSMHSTPLHYPSRV